MAEKKVSVRLVAEGGRRVRAELEGIGEAGAKGFGRLSSEMELANTRLASFARRAGIALAAVAAAAAAAGVAMVRSGLANIDAQAKLAQSMRTTVESIQTLTWAGELAGVSMGEIEQATKKLTTRLSEAASGSGAAVGALRRLNLTAAELQALPLDQRIVAIQDALNQFVPEAERAAVASDLFGDRAALAFLRIDSATLRDAARDVQDFGVAVNAADAAQIERTGDAIARLSLIWTGLVNRLTVAVAPALETIATKLADMARATGPIGQAITALFDNLGRLASYAATFAAVMAGRWVAGMAAAALSVRGLATALVFLRGALIRTGIGALIVGAGELVYQFSQLVARVGGVGEAFRLLGDLASEVWSRIGLSLDAALARMAAGWEGLKAAGLSAFEGTIAGVVSFGDRTAAIFQGAYDAAVAIWGSLPGAIGDFAFQAANGLISGVEAMLNGVVTRINSFIETLNAALALLPEWATGEGGVRIGILDPVELGRIGNPFEGAATAAGAAAADAFSAALSRTYLEPPDLGLGAMADDARARAEGYREAAGMLADAAGRPLASWQALKDAVTGTGTEAETALADAAGAADALTAGLNDTATAADGAGGAARDAGAAAAEGADTALTGWQAVTAALADYAAKARDIGGDIGSALVGAFQSAENAIGDFVKTGKLDFRDLVTSMIADLAKLAARRFILGPIANALSGALGGAGGIFANILHAGGIVGSPGRGRMVPALAFAGAPRMHSGGWAGLRPDEVPAILQRGERVLSRREAAGYGQAGASTVNVTINARDAESFRQSRTQVASDIARAVSLGRRGM
ncbi:MULTISPECIES: phage tail tape measure C-terminal domain-containing protein [unclassified Paracoccus (in: a-proteobacteria)]|uniref:phage tail tape measure C-terminal domain-containing protein n=1 Tax=unclassified Paracoccus (in: a-proteobacteria) TaxID=2688777 RepID=UPI0021E15B82|nr:MULTISPECIES: phage tail tape measure C-terminal domain-containing protein [unclassified Paracoccus (in: a-proteobacteria)]UXU75675.1 phage tail tape measure protein [Paracoccus sp. SMMA_5]UXU81580.1 phage tail tape measure protein [Paracoccus sp. SMMA_5_TC]